MKDDATGTCKTLRTDLQTFMIFQSELTNIDSEISQLLAQVESVKQRQSQLIELNSLTDSTLEGLANVVSKIGDYDRNAIASLKTAVLKLFTDGGNNGDNQPTDEPTPSPDGAGKFRQFSPSTDEVQPTNPSSEPNDEELPADNPVGDEWVLPSSTALTGQTCDINPDLYWENNAPDGSCWEFASPYACLLWEDAPMLEQHCTISPSTTEDNENRGINEIEGMAYIELVRHPENEALAYQRKHDGQIVCTYVGFRTKVIASSWLRAVEVLTSAVELRQAKRLEGFKWELKAKGLSIAQIDRLAAEDLTKTYRQEVTEAVKPPTYKEPQRTLPVNPDEVKPGDIVTPLLTPGDSYEIIQVMPNGILDCRSLRTGVNMGMRPGAVSLLSKGEKPQPVEPIEFNDVVEVVADGNDTVGLVGTFGRVKTVKSSRIGVEIDGQLVYFKPSELSVKAKAEVPQQQQQQSGQVLLGNRIVTNGNYVGAARRTAIANARRGTATKIAALELMKAGLSPELAMAAATGTDDDASDF